MAGRAKVEEHGASGGGVVGEFEEVPTEQDYVALVLKAILGDGGKDGVRNLALGTYRSRRP